MKYFIIAVVLLLGGCSSNPKVPIDIDSVRIKPEGMIVVKKDVKRDVYLEALKNQDFLRKLRLVPIVNREGQEAPAPEYRLFSVLPGSPAEVLGLANADVLVAANRFIIYDPGRFKAYLNMLAREQKASIEVRRGGEELLFEYDFID